ncbi:MAG: 50S ribosomal protein L11 methyltransferase, partial [Pseudomonadota bacterium]
PLTRLAPKLTPLLAPGGHIILSGLITHQEPLVRAAYNGRGLHLVKRLRRDGWSTLVLRRSN